MYSRFNVFSIARSLTLPHRHMYLWCVRRHTLSFMCEFVIVTRERERGFLWDANGVLVQSLCSFFEHYVANSVRGCSAGKSVHFTAPTRLEETLSHQIAVIIHQKALKSHPSSCIFNNPHSEWERESTINTIRRVLKTSAHKRVRTTTLQRKREREKSLFCTIYSLSNAEERLRLSMTMARYQKQSENKRKKS
jgi:hypothetical protein